MKRFFFNILSYEFSSLISFSCLYRYTLVALGFDFFLWILSRQGLDIILSVSPMAATMRAKKDPVSFDTRFLRSA